MFLMFNLTLPLLRFISIFGNTLGTNNLKIKDWSYQPKLKFYKKKHSTKKTQLALYKKLSFPLMISSVNVTKSLMENFIFSAVLK